jgi:8-oxo-dGTP pyrophosphatase MutT (NUDIX family)
MKCTYSAPEYRYGRSTRSGSCESPLRHCRGRASRHHGYLTGHQTLGAAPWTRVPQVAVAIVTSRRGVLVGRHRDGMPPWTFPGGKIEPGESSQAAAVPETLEETGLRVRATGVIGRDLEVRRLAGLGRLRRAGLVGRGGLRRFGRFRWFGHAHRASHWSSVRLGSKSDTRRSCGLAEGGTYGSPAG